MTFTAPLVRAQMTGLFATAFTGFVKTHAAEFIPDYCSSMFVDDANHAPQVPELPRLLDLPPTLLMTSHHRNIWTALTSSSGSNEVAHISSRARESARNGKVNFDIQWALVQGIIHLAAGEADRSSDNLNKLHADMKSFKAEVFKQHDVELSSAETQLASAALFAANAKSRVDRDFAARKFLDAAEAFSCMQWSSGAAMLNEITAEMFEQSFALPEDIMHARLQAAMLWFEADVNKEHIGLDNRENAIYRGIVNGMIGDPNLENSDVDGLLWTSANLHLERDQVLAANKDLIVWGYRMLLRNEPLDDDHMSNIVVSLLNISETLDGMPGAESIASATYELAKLADEIARMPGDPDQAGKDVQKVEFFIRLADEPCEDDNVEEEDIDDASDHPAYELVVKRFFN